MFFTALGAQAQQRTIYIAPDDHTDYYWSQTGDAYRGSFLRMLDKYLDNIKATAGQPADFQQRWNTDGTIWLWEYERNRAGRFAELVGRIKDGHISVPLNTLVATHGGTPVEGVLRDMYYAGRLQRRYGLTLPIAQTMENATIPYGLEALFAGSGARYTWHGICGCIGGQAVQNPGNRKYDAYWWIGPDGSRMLMKWNSFQPQLPSAIAQNQGFGGYAEARYASEAIDQTSTTGFTSRYPYSTIGIFGQGWDDAETVVDLGDAARSFPTIAKARTTASTRVVVSSEVDYFQAFEKQFGAKLPHFAGSFGNEWDLGSASLANLSAAVKREIEKLRSAEALATLASLANPAFLNGRSTARDNAFFSIGAYFEHNWGGGPGATDGQRLAWQRGLVATIQSYVDKLYLDGTTALGQQIASGGAANPRLFVFNPLSWARTDVASYTYAGPSSVHVVDTTTGKTVESEIASVGTTKVLRFVARNVPSVGYTVYEIQPGPSTGFPAAATISAGTIDTPFYSLAVNARGAITRLIYKAAGNADLAATIGGLAINDIGGSSGTAAIAYSGPVSATLRVDVPSAPSHTAQITVYRAIPRIDIRDDINENFSDTRTWSFGFNLPNPIVRHEEVGAVVRARLIPDGIYYVNPNPSDGTAANDARYDWLTLNHYADMTRGDGGLGVTVSNTDDYFMSLGNSTLQFLDTTTPQINVLAGGLISIGPSGQGGDTRFTQHFSLQPHQVYNQPLAMRFALEHQNPLVVGAVTGTAAVYPATTDSFLSISNPKVLLWALKPAEEGIGSGVIARVWNQTGSATSFTMNLAGPYAINSAKVATHIETDIGPAQTSGGVLQAALASQQIATYRLTVGGATGPR